jgi:hypothetical protein
MVSGGVLRRAVRAKLIATTCMPITAMCSDIAAVSKMGSLFVALRIRIYL